MVDPPPQNFFTEYSSYFTPVVSVVASFFVSRVTAKYVSKKAAQKRTFIELLESLDNLEEAVIDLLLVAGNNEKAQALFQRVCMLDKRLGRRITELFTEHRSDSRLAGSDPIPPVVSRSLIALRAIATADELVSANRAAYSANGANFEMVSGRVSQLRDSLRTEAQAMKCSDLE